MSIKKIPCGGFYYDDESISFEKDEFGRDVIRAAGGGSDNVFAVKFTWVEDESEEGGHYICDKTYEEIIEVIRADELVVVAYDGYKVYNVANIEEGDEINIYFASYTFGITDNSIDFYKDEIRIGEDNTITEQNTEKQIDTQ